MKRLIGILVVSFVMSGLSFCLEAHEGHEGKEGGSTQSAETPSEGESSKTGDSAVVQGEVMDLYCYSTHPDTGKGASHAKCAKQCIDKGIPVGILTQDGVLYVALGAEHGPANKTLSPYAGKTVEIEGHIREVNGVKFVEVEKVKESKRSVSSPSKESKASPHSHEGHKH